MNYFLVHLKDARVWQISKHIYAEDGKLVDEWVTRLSSSHDFVRDGGLTPENTKEVKVHFSLNDIRNWWSEKVGEYGYVRCDNIADVVQLITGETS